MSERPGELAIVLHTHMPYVEGGGEFETPDKSAFLPNPDGFGTWPFGEEWLWEAIATSYLPLLDVLEAAGPDRPTLSLTPVLCDQLEAPGAVERGVEFLRTVRPASHRLDLEFYSREAALTAELERSEAEYAAAGERLSGLQRGEGLLNALGRHARWTSSATHAVLPLLCTDAGIELQVATGIEAHRRRFDAFGQWQGGFWLPECAHAPWLNATLEETGVRATCVELTSVFGRGDERHLRPLRTDDGPVLWPIDRALIDLAWGGGGYPSGAAYRSYESLTPRDHRIWANDGSPYDPRRAADQVRRDARAFVDQAVARVSAGGIAVCAFDTELFGHWWYEGVDWLAAVIEEADGAGLRLTSLDDALERHATALALAPELPPTSWGEAADLRTWSAPKVAEFAWRMRGAELRVMYGERPPSDRALRELLALQASDWAFIAYREWAGDYPHRRAAGHLEGLERALAGGATLDPALRNLAPVLAGRG